VVCNHIFKMVKRRRLYTKEQALHEIAKAGISIAKEHAITKVHDMIRKRQIVNADLGPAANAFEGMGLGLKKQMQRGNLRGTGKRSRSGSVAKSGRSRKPSLRGSPMTGSRYPFTQPFSDGSISSMNDDGMSYSSVGGNPSGFDMYGPARRVRKTRIFPTKRKASKAQRMVSTLTPARKLTYQFNGVMESQQLLVQTNSSLGAPTPFSSAEFAYGANTSVPTVLSGIYGNIAQDKADPGCNAWMFQSLFHGSVIEQLSRMCATNSDAAPGLGVDALNRNNMFYISSYSVVHTLHNPTSSPIYVNRYEIVPRLNIKNVSDLMFCLRHQDNRGDNVVDPLSSSIIVASSRNWRTPDVNPNEFPIWKSRFRIIRKKRFTINPGQTITIPFAGKMNRRIDMNEFVLAREQTPTATQDGEALRNEWGSDASFLQKGLAKILCYQAFGVPAVQGVSDNTTIGSVLSNRATTTPAQIIVRAVIKYTAHGAVDTARRYATLRLNSDAVETASSAVSGIPGNTTHQITVTNQI